MTLWPVLPSPASSTASAARPDAAEIAAWNIDVAPDGAGLPPGRAASLRARPSLPPLRRMPRRQGRCRRRRADTKARGGAGTLASAKPVKTVGSYWPYSTTLYDYIHRAMPLGNAQSLSPDEVYAVTAYALSLNGIVGTDAVLDAHSLPAVRMPNRDGFVATPDQPGR